MIIGITGNSGAGKTAIAKQIVDNEKSKQVIILDADKIAKELAVPGKEYFSEIINRFGHEILSSESVIDRKKLANIIFTNLKEKEVLDSITYKYVVEEIKDRIKKVEQDVIIDAPLLIESGLNKICDITISVLADKEIKVNRICNRDSLGKEDALLRLNSQKEDEFYIKNSNYVVINNNIDLEKQAIDIIEFLNSNLYNDTIVIIQKEDVKILQFKKLLEYNDLVHAFTLKPLDFGSNQTYSNVKESVENNYKLVCNLLGIDCNNVVRAFQTHTKNVVKVENQNGIFPKELIDVDGLVTDKKEKILSLVFADCTPIFLYDPNKKVIANVHSGWQGTLKKIAKETVNKMINEFDCDPQDIICAIGPTIRKCHFEVDEDIKNEFVEAFKNICNESEFVQKGNIENNNQKYYIDTVCLNKKMLVDTGILEENIIDSNICTVCSSNSCHSYRAEKENSGRSTSIICKI